MIKSKKLLWFGSMLTVALLIATFFVPTTLAAEEEAIPTLYDNTTETINSIETEATELGIEVPGTFYWLKNWGRSIQKTFTFNPIKKAEIDLTQASEQLIKARAIAATSDDPVVQEKVEAALVKYEERMEKIKERSDEFRAKAPELADKFMEKLTDRQIKQQDIMSKMSEKMSEEALQHMSQIKEKTMEHYGEVVGKLIQNKEQIAGHVMAALENQNKTDFNRLKHVEILKSLENKVPAEAVAAIIKAENNVLEKFKTEADRLPNELKELNYINYLEKVRRAPSKSIEIFEKIQDMNILPANVSTSLNLIKEERTLKADILMNGIENMDEASKMRFEKVQEQTQAHFEMQKEEASQIRTRLDDHYEDLPAAQKEMLNQYKQDANVIDNISNENLSEAQKKSPEQMRAHAPDGINP